MSPVWARPRGPSHALCWTFAAVANRAFTIPRLLARRLFTFPDGSVCLASALSSRANVNSWPGGTDDAAYHGRAGGAAVLQQLQHALQFVRRDAQ